MGGVTSPGICVDDVVSGGGSPPIMPGEDPLEDVGYVGPADAAVEEGGHRHLVGGVQPGRSGAADPPGLVGQPEAREGVSPTS